MKEYYRDKLIYRDSVTEVTADQYDANAISYHIISYGLSSGVTVMVDRGMLFVIGTLLRQPIEAIERCIADAKRELP